MNKSQNGFVIDALNQEENLSDWEINFIRDIAEKPEDYELSEKQNAVLNRIQGKLD